MKTGFLVNWRYATTDDRWFVVRVGGVPRRIPNWFFIARGALPRQRLYPDNLHAAKLHKPRSALRA